VGAVDRYPAILSGLRAELTALDSRQHVVRCAPTVDALLADSPELDVVLLGAFLDDGSRPGENVRRIVEAGANVLIFSEPGRDALVREALSNGALGIVLKDQDVAKVAEAVRVVHGGGVAVPAEFAVRLRVQSPRRPQLSPREREVLELYAVGMPAKSVARRLDVKMGTVKVYLKRIRAKYASLGRSAGTRVELYQRAVEDGFIQAPEHGPWPLDPVADNIRL
jgi:DNA-binding NarL/FixJ family response regulator